MFNKATPLLILDVDGTVRRGKTELGRFVNRPEDVQVFPEAVERMREHKSLGGRILGISNQGGISLGYVNSNAVRAAFEETLRQAEGMFDDILWCHHYAHPDDAYPPCWCRKPGTKLVHVGIQTLESTYGQHYVPDHTMFVGDRPEDEECARRLDVKFVWAENWRSGFYE